MTTEQLRELDAWIAEHVMGCKMTMFGGEPAVIIGKSKFPPHTDDLCDDVKRYTADPAAAKEVREKIYERRTVEVVKIKNGLYRVILHLKPSIDQDDYIMAQSDTEESAICLAAKKLFSK